MLLEFFKNETRELATTVTTENNFFLKASSVDYAGNNDIVQSSSDCSKTSFIKNRCISWKACKVILNNIDL